MYTTHEFKSHFNPGYREKIFNCFSNLQHIYETDLGDIVVDKFDMEEASDYLLSVIKTVLSPTFLSRGDSYVFSQASKKRIGLRHLIEPYIPDSIDSNNLDELLARRYREHGDCGSIKPCHGSYITFALLGRNKTLSEAFIMNLRELMVEHFSTEGEERWITLDDIVEKTAGKLRGLVCREEKEVVEYCRYAPGILLREGIEFRQLATELSFRLLDDQRRQKLGPADGSVGYGYPLHSFLIDKREQQEERDIYGTIDDEWVGTWEFIDTFDDSEAMLARGKELYGLFKHCADNIFKPFRSNKLLAAAHLVSSVGLVMSFTEFSWLCNSEECLGVIFTIRVADTSLPILNGVGRKKFWLTYICVEDTKAKKHRRSKGVYYNIPIFLYDAATHSLVFETYRASLYKTDFPEAEDGLPCEETTRNNRFDFESINRFRCFQTGHLNINADCYSR